MTLGFLSFVAGSNFSICLKLTVMWLSSRFATRFAHCALDCISTPAHRTPAHPPWPLPLRSDSCPARAPAPVPGLYTSRHLLSVFSRGVTTGRAVLSIYTHRAFPGSLVGDVTGLHARALYLSFQVGFLNLPF